MTRRAQRSPARPIAGDRPEPRTIALRVAALQVAVLVGAAALDTGVVGPVAADTASAAELRGGGQPRRFGPLPGARVIGEGVLTWFGLRIYQARLWATGPGLSPDRPVDAEFALELEYARSLNGADIAKRSAEEMERLGHGDPASRLRWLDRMRALFPDVKRGDRIAGVNRPGSGARFYLNGDPLGSIDEPAFAEAFFAIWFDPRTTDPALRGELLGRNGRSN